MPVWLHQELTYYLKGFPCWDFLSKGQKLVLEMVIYVAKTNNSEEDASADEEVNFLVAEVSGLDE